ncbi:MAG: hypothetical protein KBB83_02615 [Alphaproteobacteria bacterium]|nr:hypothetical protein [Alphaproteobacteria bacterium]
MINTSRLILSLITMLALSMPVYSSDSEDAEIKGPLIFSSWSLITKTQLENPDINERLGTGITHLNLAMIKPTMISFAVRVDHSLPFSQARGPLDQDEIRTAPVEDLEDIDLANLRIGCVFGLSYFKQLKKLRLRGNLLEVLPQDLKSLKLEWLDITDNLYKTVPEKMFEAMNSPDCPLNADRDFKIAYNNTVLIKFLEHNGCTVVQKYK